LVYPQFIHFSAGALMEPAEMAVEMSSLAAHPAMPTALRALATNVLELYRRRPILNLVMNDRGRMAVSHIALHLHYSADPADPGSGLTTNRFKQVCAEAGLGSPGRAVAILALMRFAGLLVPAAASQRGQRRRLVPTEAFLALQRDRLRQGFTALAHLRPEGARGLALLGSDDFLARFMRALGEELQSSSRPILLAPRMAFFFERNAGAMILLSLLLSGSPTDTMPPSRAVAVSLADLARRFSVSRTHVTRLFVDAETEGLLQRDAVDRTRYRMAPVLRETVIIFTAALLALLTRCIAAALDERNVRREVA
jgi:AraC-like DNA-binding protein